MPGLTFDHRLRGESETALILGSYWFPAIVYEMTLAPRPASPGTNVPSRNRSAPLELCATTVAAQLPRQPPCYWDNRQNAQGIPSSRAPLAQRPLRIRTDWRSPSVTHPLQSAA